MNVGRGSCLCAGVAYELTELPRRVLHCHCSRCRKVRGTGHATNAVAAQGAVRYLRGEELLVRYRDPSAQHFAHVFCRVCGSSMPNVDAARGIAVIPMGSFDQQPDLQPDGHIFVGSKADWDVISDELPQYEDGVPVT